MNREKKNEIISEYVTEIKRVLNKDFEKAVLYGSYARNEEDENSDIDIAIFTNRRAEEFYILIEKISELTFEYSVQYDLILSPVFQNIKDFEKWKKVLPYYQNIQKEGIAIATGGIGAA
ncbi:MAG: nucleotidyltransferase domain-containing protein [Lachnospiraceae bacterium]|nr:nucleotidyltransferase domain-containing protein [Lachnospiraceae bacterium]MDY5774311.1 nucleotidyltransferase domain-containing protein [Lachnospiraceae bacterium]